MKIPDVAAFLHFRVFRYSLTAPPDPETRRPDAVQIGPELLEFATLAGAPTVLLAGAALALLIWAGPGAALVPLIVLFELLYLVIRAHDRRWAREGRL